MPTIDHEDLQKLTQAIFEKAGAPREEAAIISNHLVEANLMGHDSHGVIRVVGYARGMQSSDTKGCEYETMKETPATAVIDARGGLGIVAATRAMKLSVAKARNCTFGAVGIHNCTHTGRLGAFPVLAAREGMVGICMLNGGARFVAPFGGTEGRMPPNPLAFAAPRAQGDPVVLDIATSSVAGGKVEVKRVRGEPLPEGWMIDSEGKPVTDAERIWSSENPAAVLPLGGLEFGHKGFGLGFMVDCLAGGLSAAGCSREQPTRGASGFLAIAIKIEDFVPLEEFEQEVDHLAAWLKACPTMPDVDEVYLPGEIENRRLEQGLRNGLVLDEPTWIGIMELANELNLSVPAVA